VVFTAASDVVTSGSLSVSPPIARRRTALHMSAHGRGRLRKDVADRRSRSGSRCHHGVSRAPPGASSQAATPRDANMAAACLLKEYVPSRQRPSHRSEGLDSPVELLRCEGMRLPAG